jgi:hypothetical protein
VTDPRRANGCQHGEAAITELAGETHDESERPGILSDVASGACCSDREQLLRVADCLLLLAPEIDPPIGFEMRVIERWSHLTRA